MCHRKPAKQCSRCESCWYCSAECQKADWPSHKLLCRAFANKPARPSPHHRLAILFDTNATAPQLVWLACHATLGDDGFYHPADYHPYLGKDSPHSETVNIIANPVRGRYLATGFSSAITSGYAIQTIWRSDFLTDESALNQTIIKTARASGVVPHPWCGPMLAIREYPGENCGDIDLADLRHVIDYLLWYMSDAPRELTTDGELCATHSIRGVKICCDGEKNLRGGKAFIEVEVERTHPMRSWQKEGMVSQVTKLLDMPVRIWPFPYVKARAYWNRQPKATGCLDNATNENAFWLLTNLDLKGERWGWATFNWTETTWNIGNVIAGTGGWRRS